ncbi:MAG: ribosome maturation factor RimM [Treponema sp.]|jgi:16S rRNA processing protein RimM|nr:ribosome maturation factor RimM [Treponema sp.]
MTERFVTAILGAPFGLAGRVKVKSLSGEDNHLLKLQKVTLRKGELEKEYAIEEVFGSPLSVKLKGIDSPEAARELKGAEILIPREGSAPLKEDEFYIEDLRGLEVVSQGKTAGTISDLFEGGGGFLAELVLVNGEKKLVPFRNEFFGKIDLKAGTVELLNTWILE